MHIRQIVILFFLAKFIFGNTVDLHGQSLKDSLCTVFYNEEIDINVRWDAMDKLLKSDAIIAKDELQKIISIFNKVKEDGLSDQEKFNFQIINGNLYKKANDTKVAEKYFDTAYKLYNQNGKKNWDLTFLNKYSVIKNELGKNTEAVALMLEQISISQKEQDWTNLSINYHNLGNYLISLRKTKEAKDAYNKGFEIADKHNLVDLKVGFLESAGLDALNAGDLKDAEAKLLEAISLTKDGSNTIRKMEVKNNLAVVYGEMGKYEKASLLYSAVEEVFKKENYIVGLANVNLDKGNLEMKKKNFSKAIEYCEIAKEKYFILGNIESITSAYYCLYDAAKRSNNFKMALYYLEENQKYIDSLRVLGNVQQITELRKDFEFEREKEKTEIIHLQELTREKTFQKFLGLGLLLLVGMLFFAYRAYRIKTKINTVISQQNSQLEKFNAANENLIYSLSHDIKEPMLGVQILLNKMKSKDTTIQNAADSIGDQVAFINGIVNNLLQLKKSTTSGKVEKIDIEELLQTIDSVLNSLVYKIQDKDIIIENRLTKDNLIAFPVSKQKFYLALLNLLTNAIKHSSQGGTIEIYIKGNGVYVRDFGNGIPNELISKLGKQYLSNDDQDGSSGLGLMLVSNILAGTGVALSFSNIIGGGAEVGIKLV